MTSFICQLKDIPARAVMQKYYLTKRAGRLTYSAKNHIKKASSYFCSSSSSTWCSLCSLCLPAVSAVNVKGVRHERTSTFFDIPAVTPHSHPHPHPGHPHTHPHSHTHPLPYCYRYVGHNAGQGAPSSSAATSPAFDKATLSQSTFSHFQYIFSQISSISTRGNFKEERRR